MLGKIFLFFVGYLLIRMVIYYFRARSVFNQMVKQARQQQAKSLKKEGEITISFDKNGKRKKSGKNDGFTDVEILD